MAEKKSFMIYLDNEKQVNMLTDEQAGKLFKALFEFAKDGTETDFKDGMTAMIFSFMADSITRDTAKYNAKCEKNKAIALEREANRRAERERQAQKLEHERVRTYTNSTDIDNDKDKDIDKDIDNDNDKDIEKEKEKEKEKDSLAVSRQSSITVQNVVNLYNEICVSLPKIRKLSTPCQQNVEKITSAYTEDEIRETFEKAEKSLFLKGKKNSDETKFRDWKASFEWLVQEEHFVNTINGKYDNSEEDEKDLAYEQVYNSW